jgi:hypothetical protein
MWLAKLIGGPTIAIVAVIYVYGIFLAGVTLAPSWAIRGSWPEWPWWQYLLVPALFGGGALALEWVFQPVAKWLELGNKNPPQWKRAAAFCLFFFGGVALLAAGVLVQEWWDNR